VTNNSLGGKMCLCRTLAATLTPMQHHTIYITRTAHYYTLGTPGPAVRQFWIVCHGYAQLAEEFLENFRLLDTGKNLVVAPEGLNHFYRKGFDGPVGANWMTRHQRLSEIQDYSNYLQAVYEHYLPQLPDDVRIIILGFSQGTATVCRWALEKQPRFHNLLLWAGLPPEDLDYAAHKDYLSDKNLYLLYGTHDPFLTPDRMNTVQDIEDKNDIDFGERSFEGGHEILPETLKEMMQNFN